jgi:S1-C subfamily serine protease
MKRLFRQPIFYLTLLVISGSAGCTTLRSNDNAQAQPTSPPANQLNQLIPQTSPAPNPGDLNYVARVVQEVGPAVVRINATRTVRQSFDDFGLDEFFGGQAPSRERVQRGTGSGFITTADGRVITNAHVVEGADGVSVILKDGRRLDGKVVGTDPLTDIAVIKINASGLPTVKIGNSDNLIPGQFAIAIGNPLGLDNTVTQGIISATGRSSSDVGVPDKRIDFIQTDAAINPGNSGGPLLNAQGEVIGVNTAIIQGAQGLGFAIPIAAAQRVAEQLATKGRMDHPYLGIRMAELTPELQEEINRRNLGFEVNQKQGVIVLSVLPNSPAARAGLRAGDVVQSINGTTIENSRQVQRQVDDIGIGNSLEVTINRNGKNQKLSVKPEALPDQERS